ncbi:MAG: DUF481 domain-containing protein [Flavobacteriales bacterium]|nr:DUF481 domain-containing protein [Flavobacteriales bacterium]
MKSRLGGSLLIMFLPLSFNVSGQIMNIEKFRLDSLSRENPFRLKLEMNFDFYNRSATEDEQARFTALGSDLSFVYAPGEHFYMVLGEVRYVENNSEKILNNGNLHVRSTFNFRKGFSPELFAQAQYDNFRGLNTRLLAGGAVRWNSIINKDLRLTIGTGPMYEYERWTSPLDQDMVEIQLPKWSTNIIVRWSMNDYIDFNTILYYQVGYDEMIKAARNRLTNSTNLNFRINKKLSFKIGTRLAYEDRPVVPITKFIYSVENGININF